MRIIREAAIDWNKYSAYESKFKQQSAREMAWQLQSWQGWFPEETIERNNQAYISDCYLKYSFYCLTKTFGDNIIIWNTASESIVALTLKEKEEVDNNLRRGNNYSAIVKSLFEQGILVQEEDEEFTKFDFIRNRAATKEDNVKNFIIIPTTKCNARCFYCFAKEDLKNQEKMSLQTADDVVRFVASQIKDSNEVVFRWFGGEPLIADDIIDYIISKLDSLFCGKLKYYSIITSNTSLLTDTIIDKAINSWHLKKIHLTIDGYKKEHDKRKSYYDKNIDQYSFLLQNVQKLLNKGIYTIVRVNLDKKNYENIDLILKDLAPFKCYKNFFVHLTNLQPSNNNSSQYYLSSDYPYFYRTVYDKLFSKGFYQSIDTLVPRRQMSLCTAGLSNFILINYNGNLFKCDKEGHNICNSIGNCKKGVIHNKRLAYWMDTTLENECRKCKYLPICQGGCKFYRESGNTDLSPCIKQRYYLDVIFELINDYFLQKDT